MFFGTCKDCWRHSFCIRVVFSISLSLTHMHTHILSLIPLSLLQTHTHSLFLIPLTLLHNHILFFSHSLTYTHAHIFFLSLSHTHTHKYANNYSLSVSRPLAGHVSQRKINFYSFPIWEERDESFSPSTLINYPLIVVIDLSSLATLGLQLLISQWYVPVWNFVLFHIMTSKVRWILQVFLLFRSSYKSRTLGLRTICSPTEDQS